MQQVRQRSNGSRAPIQAERISWARAMIFGVGFFFLGALLIGQLPGYIFDQMTASSLVGLEQGSLALAAICLASFIVIQVVVLLFDPKPVVPPAIIGGLGFILTLAGLAIVLAAAFTNNQYFPAATVKWNPVLGGNVLWFPAQAVDLIMLGTVILGVGIAMLFFSALAVREQRNPDRSDPGTTPAIRAMISIGITLLIVFMIFYTLVSDTGLAKAIDPQCPFAVNPAKGCPGPITGLFIVNTIFDIVLAAAVLCTLGAFALRLHYLMRPVRKRTMAGLYVVGINLAPFGAIFLLVWFVVYPLIAWMHSWSLIGLGSYLTVCARMTAIPATCSFSQQAGYIIDAVVTTNFFVLLLAAVAVWRTRRNLIIIGGVTITAVLALATLVVHMHPDEIFVAMLLCGAALVLAVIWTSVARREFAVVGENKLGCVGQWLVIGTCLIIYLAAFAFFSIPGFRETNPNIPFVPGVLVNNGSPGRADAIVVFVLMGLLAGIQFYFLVRNRYHV
jgi:hypothetical protein